MLNPMSSEFRSIMDQSDRIRRSNMSLCTATDPEQSLENRLESAREALAQWTIGSFQYENVLKQLPDLKNLLVVKRP